MHVQDILSENCINTEQPENLPPLPVLSPEVLAALVPLPPANDPPEPLTRRTRAVLRLCARRRRLAPEPCPIPATTDAPPANRSGTTYEPALEHMTKGVPGHTEPSAGSSAATLECQLEFAQSDGLAVNLERQLTFVGADGYIELQALHVRLPRKSFRPNFAAHTDSLEVAVALCESSLVSDAQGIYIIPARLKPGVETRRPLNRWNDVPKDEGTTDNDIAARTVLPVDLDVKRPKHISATDEQMELSVAVALKCWAYLASILGEGTAGSQDHGATPREFSQGHGASPFAG